MNFNKWRRDRLLARARKLDKKAAKLRARVKELTPKRPKRTLAPVEDVNRNAA